MPSINKEISNTDKLGIYARTAFKLFRGSIKGIGIKKKSPIFIGRKVEITHKGNIYCGKNVKFESYSEIHGLATNGLRFGNNVTIGRFTSIRPWQIGYGLEISENSSIGPYGYIGCSGKVRIGKNVMIGPRVSLFAENHNFSEKDISIKEQGVNNKGITIEDDCWIGSGVIILDGVTVGSGSVIGAGTLVTKDIPKNSIIYDKRNRVENNR